MYKPEEIMVFESSLLHDVGYFCGFSTEWKKYFGSIIESRRFAFMSRDLAEQDTNYKQIIPYIVIKSDKGYLSYQRGKLLSEKRLTAKYSIGFGGHVKYNEAAMTGDYTYSLKRELREELGENTIASDKLIGVINDDSDEVGKVHFGFVHEITMEKTVERPNEKSINKLEYIHPDALRKRIDKYENWSRFIIENL